MSQSSTWTQSGSIPLANGQGDATVVFPAAFAVIPFSVTAQVIKPGALSDNIDAFPYIPTLGGFSVSFSSGVITAPNYILAWTATAQQPTPEPPFPPCVPCFDECCAGPDRIPFFCPDN